MLPPAREGACSPASRSLIIAEDIEGEALATLVVNKIRGTFNAAAVKAPGFGDRRKAMLQDIAILTGAAGDLRGGRPQARERRRSTCSARARKVVITKDATTIVEGPGDAEAVRAASTRSRPRSRTPTRTGTARSSRSGSRSSPAASRSIKVGAATEVELKEKKHRIEDAVSATRAAVEEGIVPGGGVTLIRAEVGAGQARPRRRRGHRARTSCGARWPSRRVASRRTPATRARSSSQQLRSEGEGTRLRRRHRRVGRHGQGRHHRPGQGHPLGAAERGLDRGDRAHGRSPPWSRSPRKTEAAAGDGHGTRSH